jgi:hypothetical protein
MKASRLELVRSVSAMIAAQLVLTGLATHFASLSVRPLVMFAVTASSMMVIAALLGVSRKTKVAAIILSASISIVCVYWWRRLVDPLGFIGAIPASLEIPALGVSAVLTVLFATVVAFISDRKRRAYRFRWAFVILFSIVGGLLPAGIGWHFLSKLFLGPPQILASVVQMEEAGVDEVSVQQLATFLAFLGRDDEVRRMDMHPQSKPAPSTVEVGPMELTVVPWRDGIREIAAKHRVVMIMEHHVVSKSREWIGGTLPAFRDAGFTHYAAEAILESGAALKKRGYPASETGTYTADPKFGNVLRRALDLKFEILGYDYDSSTHERREEFAATELAKLLQTDAKTKLLVHAGHAHVLKYKTKLGERWLASLLWDKTGIEPFTIWQWSSLHDARDYEKIARELKSRGLLADEPVLLMPPPAGKFGIRDAPYGLARVDAIVMHPPDQSMAPAGRTTLFPDAMQKVSGKWTAKQWPVVVSAYSQGEPVNAIPLDQIMLRKDEAEFVLWIPNGAEYEIRVFNQNGLLRSITERDGSSVAVGLTALP